MVYMIPENCSFLKYDNGIVLLFFKGPCLLEIYTKIYAYKWRWYLVFASKQGEKSGWGMNDTIGCELWLLKLGNRYAEIDYAIFSTFAQFLYLP